MLGNAVRTIFLFGVSSWPRRSVRCPGRTRPKANRPLKAPLWPHLQRGFLSRPPRPPAWAAAQVYGTSSSIAQCLPGVPTRLKLRLGLFQGRHAIRARHRAMERERPEPPQIIRAASHLIDAADIPLAAEHGVVGAVLVDPGAKAGRAHGECHESIGLRRELVRQLRPQVLDQLAHGLGDGFDALEVENLLVDALEVPPGS